MTASLAINSTVASAQRTASGTNADRPDADERLLALMCRMESCSSREQVIEIVTSLVTASRCVQTLALVTPCDHDSRELAIELLSGLLDFRDTDVREGLITAASRGCQQRRPVVAKINGRPDLTVMAAPVTAETDSGLAFVAVLEPSADGRETQVLLQNAAAAFSYGNALCTMRSGSAAKACSQNLISHWVDVLAQGSSRLAAQTLVEHLAEVCRARGVALGRWNPARETTDLLAISSAKGFDPRSERVQQYRAAFDECMIKRQATSWSRTSHDDEQSSLILKQLAEGFGCSTISCIPLPSADGNPPPMIMVLGDWPNAQQVGSLVGEYARFVQPTLDLHRRADGRGIGGVVGRTRRWFVPRRNRAIVIACLTILAGLFLPVTHKIHCDCVTQPVTRRFVVTPFAGTLKTVLVRLGARVAPGQVLAIMDGREIELELASIVAELDRARSQRDGHLAVKDFVAAELARYEIDRLEIRKRLLLHRQDTLAIKSPIAGLVIAGDLADSEGAPVTVGQGLFEVAPLDQLIVETAIPEDQISYVRTGLPLEIHTDACPDRLWRRPLERIHPQTEERDDRYVFIGETVIENRDRALRPGMHGQVAIHAGQRPLGWCLFHRAWEKVRIWTGW